MESSDESYTSTGNETLESVFFKRDISTTQNEESKRVIVIDQNNDEFYIQIVTLKDTRLIRVNELFWDGEEKNDSSVEILVNVDSSLTQLELMPTNPNSISLPTILLLVLFFFLSITVSALGALPYLTYSGEAPESIKEGICITRYIIYLIIFSSHWLYVSTDLILRYRFSIMRSMYINWSFIARQVLDNLFTITYTMLYAVKWIALENIPQTNVSIPCFCISWILVYYSIIDKHLSSSISASGSPSSNLSSRKRRMLLKSVKNTEKMLSVSSVKERENYICNLIEEKNLSLFFSSHVCKGISLSEERLVTYEKYWHDGLSEILSDIVNGMLGFSLIPLTLALLEDYGAAVKLIVNDEDVFLWVLTIASLLLGILYLIATRPIHHKTCRVLTSMPTKSCFFSSLMKLPVMAAAVSIGSLRVNMSFMIFGRLTGRFMLPFGLSQALIWSGIIIVFYIDYGTCLKILSCSFKMLFTLLSLVLHRIFEATGYPCKLVKYLVTGYTIRWYTKYAKWLVRNCDEDLLDSIFENIL